MGFVLVFDTFYKIARLFLATYDASYDLFILHWIIKLFNAKLKYIFYMETMAYYFTNLIIYPPL